MSGTPLDRAQFPVTENYTYLNHAAAGALPARTRDALAQFVNDHADGGIARVWPYEANLPDYRATIAGFINARPHEIAVLRNTGDGANVIAAGLPWSAGDEIITNDNEFPANAYPWLAAQHAGATVKFIDTRKERMTPDVLRRAVSSRTQVVAVSWVSFDDGYRHDLEALAEVAHEAGALFCVDVIQGLGAFPLDVAACKIDAAYGGGAKWLLSLQGVSFLYVRESLIERLRLAAPGWRSAADIWDFYDYEQPFASNASRFEGGTPNFIGALSMHESISVLAAASGSIGDYVLMLTDYFYERLQAIGATVVSPRGAGCSSGIVTFSLPGQDPVALGKRLGQERIVTTYRSTGIRVSPHGYNTVQEIDRLMAALTE